MSYCPEDGSAMVQRCTHFDACYTCTECDTHWTYVAGAYYIDRDYDGSEVCNVCLNCLECHQEESEAD